MKNKKTTPDIVPGKTFGEAVEDFLISDSKKATAAKFVLATLALGGIVFVGALVPALVAVLGDPRKPQKYSPKNLQQTIRTLKHRKLIEIVREKHGTARVELTNKGKKRVRDFCFNSLEIKKPKKWDGKWRILMFDIPTKPKIYNQARNALREKIKTLGFVQLQKSVWVYPYECEDEILFLAETYQIEKYIDMLVAERVMHEEKFKRKFKL